MAEAIARVGELDICYETFGDAEDPAILLIMGLGTQMLAWHEDFCEQLAARGYFVIRHDNRDIGRSSRIARRARADAQAARPARQARRGLHAQRHGERQHRRARPPRHRAGPHRRRLDGRDDRPARRDRAPGPHALAHLDHVQHGLVLERSAGAHDVRLPAAPRAEGTQRLHRPGGGLVREDRRQGLRARRRGPARHRHPLLRPRPRPPRLRAPARRDRRRPRPRPRAAQAPRPDDGHPRRGRPPRAALGRARHGQGRFPGSTYVEISGMGHGLPRGAWRRIIGAIVQNAELATPAPESARPQAATAG